MSGYIANAIYSSFFKMLAKDPTPQHVRWARKLWKKSLEYDFCPCDMHIEKELKKLGLARLKPNPDDSEEDVWFYGPKGKDTAW